MNRLWADCSGYSSNMNSDTDDDDNNITKNYVYMLYVNRLLDNSFIHSFISSLN